MATRGVQALLARLSRLNPTTVFLATMALVLAGLLLPRPAGAILLLALAGAFATVLTATWPYGTPRTRVARIVILGLLVTLAITRLA